MNCNRTERTKVVADKTQNIDTNRDLVGENWANGRPIPTTVVLRPDPKPTLLLMLIPLRLLEVIGAIAVELSLQPRHAPV